jgi:predicted dehydrogenase
MAELVRNGRIGKLKTIRVRLPQQPTVPGDPTPQPVPETLDWEMWLGPAPFASYTPDRVHFNVRWISAYSGGIVPDWGTHLFDTAQWANDTERSGPVKIVAKGSFWKGGLYDTPKEYHLEYTYANGVEMVVDHGGSGIRFEGTEGWIASPSWRAPLEASDPRILDSKIGSDGVHLYTNPAGEHRDFLDCVKSRKDPYFPVDIGHRVSTLCHLADIALRLERPLTWDPKAERFPDDAEATRLMSRPMRDPWTLA